MSSADHLYSYLLIEPAYPVLLAGEALNWDAFQELDLYEFLIFCAVVSILEWVIAISFSIIFVWWILPLWATAVFVIGRYFDGI